MKAWWSGLAQRERILVAAAALVVGLFLPWQLAWVPYSNHAAEVRVALQEERELLAWMEGAVAELRRHAGTAPSASGQGQGPSLLVLADRTVREAGLAESLQRVQPEGRQVRVWLDGAVFDDALRWLGRLTAQHGVRVTALSIERTANGRANLRITLIEGNP